MKHEEYREKVQTLMCLLSDSEAHRLYELFDKLPYDQRIRLLNYCFRSDSVLISSLDFWLHVDTVTEILDLLDGNGYAVTLIDSCDIILEKRWR